MLPPETLVEGVMRVELTGGKVSPLRAGKRGNQPSWFQFGLCFDEPSRFVG